MLVTAGRGRARRRSTSLVNNAGTCDCDRPTLGRSTQPRLVGRRRDRACVGAYLCARPVRARHDRSRPRSRSSTSTSYVRVRPSPYQSAYAAGEGGAGRASTESPSPRRRSRARRSASSRSTPGVRPNGDDVTRCCRASAVVLGPGCRQDVARAERSSPTLVVRLASGTRDACPGGSCTRSTISTSCLRRLDEIARRRPLRAPAAPPSAAGRAT